MNISQQEIRRTRDANRIRLLELASDDQTDLQIDLKKLEAKLFNNTYYYLQEHTGEFRDVFNMHIDNAIHFLYSMNEEAGCSNLECLEKKRITPRDIRKHPMVMVTPEFNPRQISKECIQRVLAQSIGDKAEEYAARMEDAMFVFVSEYCKDSSHMYQVRWNNPLFFERYKDRLSIILNHLDPTTITNRTYGTEALEKLKCGEITPEQFGVMEDIDLCPMAVKKERDEIEMRGKQQLVEKYTTLFKCPTCKARRSIAQEVQRRSLDEAADFSCVCCNCGTHFMGK